jgi:hypothetical protein
LLESAVKEPTMPHETRAAEDARSQVEIDLADRAGLERWAQALGVTAEALESAAHAVGPRIDRIKDYLGAGGMAGEQEDA